MVLIDSDNRCGHKFLILVGYQIGKKDIPTIRSSQRPGLWALPVGYNNGVSGFQRPAHGPWWPPQKSLSGTVKNGSHLIMRGSGPQYCLNTLKPNH